MSTADNKKLIQQVYADAASQTGTTFIDHLADDARWIVTGQYSWSHTFVGKEGVLNGALGHFRSLIEGRSRTVARSVHSRCRSTSGATSSRSSVVTNSRPASMALDCDARTHAIVARGLIAWPSSTVRRSPVM